MYEIYVGNIGCVLTTQVRLDAIKCYWDYVSQSMCGYGRATGEDVTMFKDGDILLEHEGGLKRAEDQEIHSGGMDGV